MVLETSKLTISNDEHSFLSLQLLFFTTGKNDWSLLAWHEDPGHQFYSSQWGMHFALETLALASLKCVVGRIFIWSTLPCAWLSVLIQNEPCSWKSSFSQLNSFLWAGVADSAKWKQKEQIHNRGMRKSRWGNKTLRWKTRGSKSFVCSLARKRKERERRSEMLCRKEDRKKS